MKAGGLAGGSIRSLASLCIWLRLCGGSVKARGAAYRRLNANVIISVWRRRRVPAALSHI